MRIVWIGSWIVSITLLVAVACKPRVLTEVPMPDYKSFRHVKSGLLLKGDADDLLTGIHHVYANDAAVEALRNRSDFPEDSVLVFDLFEPLDTPEGYKEGAHKFTAVMHKHSSFKSTGGWGYEAFLPDGKRVVADANKMCFECHKSVESQGYVFTNAGMSE